MTSLSGTGATGHWPPRTSDEEVLRIVRPADGTLVGELAVTPPPALAGRVARARSVQGGWASLEPRDRERRLRGLLSAIGARAAEIESTISAETGKPRTEAAVEVMSVVEHLRFHLGVSSRIFRRERVSCGWLLWKRAMIFREPLGVIGVISPWNYPFILSMNPVVTALAGGNAAILKPSEYTPYSGLFAEELAREAGLPDGLVQVVIGGGPTGEALVRSGVDKVVFTGGGATARRVLSAASEGLTPVLLELGGKDPAIVLEDADLGRAARGIVWGSFMNAGQTCISIERVYVVDEVFEPFLREVVARVQALKAGSTPGLDVGPITTPLQMEIVERHLRDAVERGAKVRVGGGRIDPASNVFLPTILTDVHPASDLLQEETFGPLLPIFRVKDAEEAVRAANALPFGLSASVWTGDQARGIAVARSLRAGAVSVNDALTHYGVPGLPFGGMGESGYGRTGGLEGLREVTRTRSVLVDRLGLGREPWWFPYSRASERLVRTLATLRWKGWLRGLASEAASRIKKKADR